MTEPQSGADLLARIRPRLREESTNICLRPDLLDEWQEAQDALIESRGQDAGKRMVGAKAEVKDSPESKKLAKQVQAIETRIDATQVRFTFRAASKDAYRTLRDAHPPRKGDQVDQIAGHNRDAVEDALVRACLIDPVFEDCDEPDCEHDDCGSWQAFVNVCNPSEWNELRDTVRSVNRSVTEVPKSLLAAQVLTKRASTSKRPARGESAPASSTDGRPAKSTSTSTPTAT